MPNLQKKRLIIFEIFNIKKCTLFLEPSIVYSSIVNDFIPFKTSPMNSLEARQSSPCDVQQGSVCNLIM